MTGLDVLCLIGLGFVIGVIVVVTSDGPNDHR
jgi:hypothetical protein